MKHHIPSNNETVSGISSLAPTMAPATTTPTMRPTSQPTPTPTTFLATLPPSNRDSAPPVGNSTTLPVVTVGFVLLESSSNPDSSPSVDTTRLGDMLEFFMTNLLTLATTSNLQQDSDIQLSMDSAVSYAPSIRQGLAVIKGTWVDPRDGGRRRLEVQPISDLLRDEFSQTGIRDLYQLFDDSRMSAQLITVQVDGRGVLPVQQDLLNRRPASEAGTSVDAAEQDNGANSVATLAIVLGLVAFCLTMFAIIATLIMRRCSLKKLSPPPTPGTVKEEKESEEDDDQLSTAKLGAVPRRVTARYNNRVFDATASEQGSSFTVVPGGGGSEWIISTCPQPPVSVLGDGESSFGGEGSISSALEHHLNLGGDADGEHDLSISTVRSTEKGNECDEIHKNSPGRGVSALLHELGLGNLTDDEKGQLHQPMAQDPSISLYDAERLGWNSE